MNAASIDLGTNSIKILIVRRDSDGQMHVLFRHRSVVRLGEGTFSRDGKSNKLSKEVQDRTLKVFQNYAKFLDAYNVDVVRATGTSALREAKNGPDFIREVRDKTGIALEILPAHEEARLIVKGVSSEFKLPNKPTLFIDIGGGSCEISAVKKTKTDKFASLPLGAVRLTELYLKSPKPDATQIKRLDQHVVKILKENWPNPENYQTAVGSAGTIRSLARIVSKTELTEDDRVITNRQLERIVLKISKMSKKRIAALPGVDAKRAEILTAGARVLLQAFDYFGIKELKISNRGLREGLLIDLFESPQKPVNQKNLLKAEQSQIEKDFILAIARKYHSNQAHCQHVWMLAHLLFDDLQPVHGISEKYKPLLMLASHLHDVGHFISQSSHHKHTYYILKNTEFPFLSERERQLVAVLARYHRKSPPKDDHEGYKDLSQEEKKLIESLASLLRLADALDAPHDQSVKWLKCQWGPGSVRIGVELKNGSQVDRVTFKDKAKLFESLYKVQVTAVTLEELKFVKTIGLNQIHPK